MIDTRARAGHGGLCYRGVQGWHIKHALVLLLRQAFLGNMFLG